MTSIRVAAHTGTNRRPLVLLLLSFAAIACLPGHLHAQALDSRVIRLPEMGSSTTTVATAQIPGGCVTEPPDVNFAASMLAHDERRVALVIGNGAYKKIVDNSNDRRLPNPSGDATSVASALHALGFTVIKGTDLTKSASRKCLTQFYDAAQGAKAALFYFAGHGLSAGGNTYLLPIDAHVDTHKGMGSNFLRINGQNGILQQIRQKAPSFLFLDACRNIPFGGGKPLREIDGEKIPDGAGLRGLAPLRDSDGGVFGLRDFYYAYATFPGETASDDVDSGGHSPFAGAFLRHVAEPGLDVPRLLLEMSFDVGAATSGAQLPWGEGAIKENSDLYFNGTKTLEQMIRESDQLAEEADSLRTRGQRIEAITTALRGLPTGNAANLAVRFGHAMASLYRAVQSKEVVTENSPTSCASVTAFSPDRKNLLTVIRGKQRKDCETNLPDIDGPKLWDRETGRLLRTFDLSDLPRDAQFERVLAARFSDDGKEVLLEVLPKPKPRSDIDQLSSLPERRRPPQLQWWNAVTGKFIRSLPVASPESMALQTFNANAVVMSCTDKGCAKVDVYDATNGHLRKSFDQLLEPVVRLTKHFTDAAGNPVADNIQTSALSADGRLLFVASAGNGLGGVWELDTGRLKCPIDLSKAPIPDHLYFDEGTFRRLPASFNEDGHRLAFTRDNQTVRVYDVEKCQEIRTITQNARAFLTSVELSPDGRSVFTAQTNYQMRLWSVSTGEILTETLCWRT